MKTYISFNYSKKDSSIYNTRTLDVFARNQQEVVRFVHSGIFFLPVARVFVLHAKRKCSSNEWWPSLPAFFLVVGDEGIK
jgi:hypothetical protein